MKEERDGRGVGWSVWLVGVRMYIQGRGVSRWWTMDSSIFGEWKGECTRGVWAPA